MVDFIADYYQNVESKPVKSQVKPGYLQVPSFDLSTIKVLTVWAGADAHRGTRGGGEYRGDHERRGGAHCTRRHALAGND